MAKPRGAICNLNGVSCFYLPKEKACPGSAFRMSAGMLWPYRTLSLSRMARSLWIFEVYPKEKKGLLIQIDQ